MTLLPPNASPLERGFEVATGRISELPAPLRDLWNPWTCPLSALPFLAWALSIDTWSSDWPEGVKRARVAAAIEIQRHKGTASSVRAVVKAFGGSLAIREWWEMQPAGDPHTFAIVLSLGSIVAAEKSAAYTDAVIAEIRRTKPVRSHFTFTQAVAASGGMQAVAAVRPATLARLSLAAA